MADPKPPIANRVQHGPLGVECTDCHGPVYADKIERGPQIGVRVTYRHVSKYPWCLRTAELTVLAILAIAVLRRLQPAASRQPTATAELTRCPDCGHPRSEHFPPPSQDASGGCPVCLCDRWFEPDGIQGDGRLRRAHQPGDHGGSFDEPGGGW